MRTAVGDARAHAGQTGGAIVMVSHQTPIWLCRVAFERGLGSASAPWTVRALPSWYRAKRCTCASITTLEFAERRFVGASYWAP
jgi:hypothetical protein